MVNSHHTTSVLLPHQLPPVKHLALKCREQHGLLLYHKMGTGKTRTAVAMMFEFPTYDWIVVTPRGLSQVWEGEMDKFKQYNLPVTPRFYQYETADFERLFAPSADLSNTIIVLDEAHNLVPLVEDEQRILARKNVKVLVKLDSAHKVLALTGTPVYNDDSDLRLLINVVAGKTVLPVADSAFTQDYYSVDPMTAAVQGWLLPGAAYLNTSWVWANVMRFGGKALLPWILIDMCITIFRKGTARRIDYMMPNADALHSAYRPYVSYHEYENDPNFPTVTSEVKEVDYTDAQLERWLKFAQGLLTPRELQRLGLSPDYQSTKTLKQYYSQGRMIGNVAASDGTACPRFVAIKDSLTQVRSAVVYSNFFTEGLVAFQAYLDTQKNVDEPFLFTTRFLSPEQTTAEREAILESFKAERFHVLLLHPDLIEGISIQGARQLHIMEPLESLGATDQLQARVVRYQSHGHLPVSERSVKIFHWYAIPAGLKRKMLHEVHLWLTNSMFTFFTNVPEKFPTTVSPEGFYMTRTQHIQAFLNLLVTSIKRDSIDKDQFVGTLFLERQSGAIGEEEEPQQKVPTWPTYATMPRPGPRARVNSRSRSKTRSKRRTRSKDRMHNQTRRRRTRSRSRRSRITTKRRAGVSRSRSRRK